MIFFWVSHDAERGKFLEGEIPAKSANVISINLASSVDGNWTQIRSDFLFLFFFVGSDFRVLPRERSNPTPLPPPQKKNCFDFLVCFDHILNIKIAITRKIKIGKSETWFFVRFKTFRIFHVNLNTFEMKIEKYKFHLICYSLSQDLAEISIYFVCRTLPLEPTCFRFEDRTGLSQNRLASTA